MPINECPRCHRDFGSLSAFDKHQDVDYHRRPAVICLDPASIGMHQDAYGRWRAAPNPGAGMPRAGVTQKN